MAVDPPDRTDGHVRAAPVPRWPPPLTALALVRVVLGRRSHTLVARGPRGDPPTRPLRDRPDHPQDRAVRRAGRTPRGDPGRRVAGGWCARGRERWRSPREPDRAGRDRRRDRARFLPAPAPGRADR